MWIWALLAFGCLALAGFMCLQATAAARGTEPLVPLQLFADRNYAVGSVAIVTMGFMAASMMLPLMLWLQNEKGMLTWGQGIIVAQWRLFRWWSRHWRASWLTAGPAALGDDRI